MLQTTAKLKGMLWGELQEHYNEDTPLGVIEGIIKDVENEVRERYEECPYDARFHPVHVGDAVAGLGEVVGIGDDCVFATSIKDGITKDGKKLDGYAIFPAASFETVNAKALDLVRLIADAGRAGRIDDALAAIYADKIMGFADAG